MCVQNLKFVALPVPEIIGVDKKIWGIGGRGLVPFERALVSSYRPSIVNFALSLRLEIGYCRFCAPARHGTPPLVCPNSPHVLVGVGGWPLGYEERMCWANCPCS